MRYICSIGGYFGSSAGGLMILFFLRYFLFCAVLDEFRLLMDGVCLSLTGGLNIEFNF